LTRSYESTPNRLKETWLHIILHPFEWPLTPQT
jgi:hypothetical protein